MSINCQYCYCKKTCNKNYWISEVMSSVHGKPANAQWDYWPLYGSKSVILLDRFR